MMNKILSLIIVLSLYSCGLLTDVENLGSDFYRDINLIIYSEHNEYNGSGFQVIPHKIDSLAYNDNFILASSTDTINSPEYWVIFKDERMDIIKYDSLYQNYIYSNVSGPLKKPEFDKLRKNKKIPKALSLKNIGE